MFDEIIKNTSYANSHGAEGSNPGTGFLYYGLPYMLKASRCVCLGSGAGFVPKLMYKAQQELVAQGVIEKIDITLVDADIGPWGRPEYEGGISDYPEIVRIKSLTDNAAHLFEDIDYLHVDADHSYSQIYRDLRNYGSRMRKGNWAITVHDTYNFSEGDHPEIGSYRAAVDWASDNQHDIVNFPIGCGTALIMPRIGK